MTAQLLRIGELANAASVSADTLRFYEQQNLLQPTTRSAAGYRLYSGTDIQRIGFILSAKQVGFTLAEIRQLLDLEVSKDQQSCADVKTLIDDKLDQVEHRLQHMRRIQSSLRILSDACCGGSVPATHCTILETLNDGHHVHRENNN